jgi:HlyD family secretion protein
MSLSLPRARVIVPILVGLIAVAFAVWWLMFRAIAVPVATTQSGTLPAQVHGPGSLQARVATTISARISGRIVELHADQGETVAAGALLTTLDSAETLNRQRSAKAGVSSALHQEAAAQAAINHANATLKLAEQELSRTRSLFKQGLVAKAELDKAVAAEATARGALASAKATLRARQAEVARARAEIDVLDTQLGYTRVTAPFAGLIVHRYAEPGQTVSPGTPLFRLIDPSTLWVVMRVDESQSGAVKVGQAARIKLRTGAEIRGHVARIGLQSDTTTRELEVDVALDKTPQRYAIDEEALVAIRTGEAKGAVFPASAVLRQGTQTGVLRIAGGRAVFTPIELGTVASGKAVATSGLQPGALVITRPAGIKPGTRVKPAKAPAR